MALHDKFIDNHWKYTNEYIFDIAKIWIEKEIITEEQYNKIVICECEQHQLESSDYLLS